MTSTPPRLLAIAGHDPTGGAGIQADIETALAFGVHPTTVVTCLTAQDSRDVHALYPQEPEAFRHQLEVVVRDLEPDAIKIGLIGSEALVPAIVEIGDRLGAPVVVDPILKASGGAELASGVLIETLRRELLPKATLATPNLEEARRLTGRVRPEACAAELLQLGCRAVLITGGDGEGGEVVDRLWTEEGEWCFWGERLGEGAHGSGCTLSSACAALLAKGVPLVEAVGRAISWTREAIARGWRPSQGQRFPRRIRPLSANS